jgi:hypothetical protein
MHQTFNLIYDLEKDFNFSSEKKFRNFAFSSSSLSHVASSSVWWLH